MFVERGIMDEYLVMMWESLRKDVAVKANSAEEALEKAIKAYEDGKFEINMDDFIMDNLDCDCMPMDEAIEYGEVESAEDCIRID